MATEEGLRIRIGVLVDALRKGMAKAKAIISGTTKEIASESKAVESASRSWNTMGKFIFQQTYERKRLIQQVQQGIGSWKLEAKAVEEVANKSLPALQRGTRGAASTLTSFSRIVQDAPYGIIGIGNNITQFAEQFQYLRQNTGSAGSALKALGSSIVGAGGLTLGISLLITGLTTLTQKYGSLGAAVNALLKPLTEQQRLQKLIRDTLLEGQKNAQSELVQLDKLYKATQNVNLSLSERNKIVDQLQKDYPNYFGNLSNEAILAGEAADEYDRLRDALIGAATVRAIDKQLEELGAKLATVKVEQNRLNKEVSESVRQQDRLNKEVDEFKKRNKDASPLVVAEQYSLLQAQAGGAAGAVRIATNALDKNQSEIDEIVKSQSELFGIQQSLIQQYGSMAAGVNTTTKALKEQKKAYEELDISPVQTRQDIFQRSPIPMSKIPIDIQLVGVSEAQNKLLNQLKPIQNAVETFDLSLTKQVNDVINNSVIGGIGNIAAGIGEALGSGKIEPIIHSFVNTISGFLTQMGELLIAQGVSIEAFKKSLESFQGIPAIIAGGALIVAAGAFRAFASKGIGSFATGGTAYGPQLAMIGDNPGRQEHIIPSEVLDKLGASNSYPSEIVLRAHGSDLVGVLRMGQNYNGRING